MGTPVAVFPAKGGAVRNTLRISPLQQVLLEDALEARAVLAELKELSWQTEEHLAELEAALMRELRRARGSQNGSAGQ